MLSGVLVSHNSDDSFTFRGFFGVSLKRIVLQNFLGNKKLDRLFIKLGTTEITIYSFFLLELRELIRMILNHDMEWRGINRSALETLLKKIDTETWLKDEEHVDNDFRLKRDLIDKQIKINLLDYQKELFNQYEFKKNYFKQRGILLDSFAGSGKTLMSISLSIGLDKDVMIFIVMNQNLESVWLNTFLNDPDDFFRTKYSKEMIYTSRDFNNKEYNGEKIIICHYEALDKLLALANELKSKSISMIVDEAHNFTSTTSIRKMLLLQLVEELKCEDIVMMSGTPIKGSNLEIIPYLEVLDKKFNHVVSNRYSKLYSSPNHFLKTILPIRFGSISMKVAKQEEQNRVNYKTFKIKIPNGKEYTLSAVRDKMRDYSIKRTEELLKKKPEYEERYKELLDIVKSKNRLDASEWKNYDTDIKFIIREYNKNNLKLYPDLLKRVSKFEKVNILPYLDGNDKKDFKDSATIVKYLKFKVIGEMLGRVFMHNRMLCHRDMASHLDYGFIQEALGKTIIASGNIEVVEEANRRLERLGYKYLTVYGNNSKNVGEVVREFVNNKEANPLTGTYNTLSTGHHLIVANTVLCLDLPFRPYLLEQFIARVNRLGQKHPVYCIYTELDTGEEYNINSRNIDILKWAKDVVEEVTGHSITGMDLDNAVTTELESKGDLDSLTEDMQELNNILTKTISNFNSYDSYSYYDDYSEIETVDDTEENTVEVKETKRIESFNKASYVEYAVTNDLLSDIDWYKELFGIVEKDGKYKYTENKGGIKYVKYYNDFVTTNLPTNIPILKIDNIVKLKKECMRCLENDIYTSIGLVISNYLFIEKSLEGKMNYINREFSHKEIYNLLPKMLSKGIVTISNLHNYINAISMSLGMNKLFVVNATKKLLVAAPGMKEFKEKLTQDYDKKYGEGWKKDSRRALAFVKELENYDRDYIKDDKSFGKLMSGKILNNSRPRKFIAFGVENGFGANEKPVFISNSLMDGYPKNKEELAAVYNGARSGSYDRGAGTQEAGYMVKQMQKAVNSLVIHPGDCGDTTGDKIFVTEDILWLYNNIYIIENGQPVLKENLNEYVGKYVRVRSPKFCKNDGSYCETCVGVDTGRFNNGISLMVIACIGVLLGIKMSSMHKATKELMKFNITDTII